MSSVCIFNQTDREIEELETVEKVLMSAIEKEKLVNTSFNLIIVDNNYIHELNKNYRHIDRETDVISFAFLDDKNEIINNSKIIDLGEIYICYDICLKNAKKYGNSFDREFCFLFIHGLLHLLGYDHQTKEQEEVMFKLQDEILPPKEN